MVLNWFDFIIFLFWSFFFILFIFNHYLINLFLLNEILWILLFIYFSIFGLYLDIFIIVFISIGILGVATGESVIGLALIILKTSYLPNFSFLNILNNKNYYFYRFKKFSSKIKS